MLALPVDLVPLVHLDLLDLSVDLVPLVHLDLLGPTNPGEPTEQTTQGHVSGNNVTSNGAVQQRNHETSSTNKLFLFIFSTTFEE
jgi:hypothetical protein